MTDTTTNTTSNDSTAAAETTLISKFTGAVGGYFDAVVEQPLQHGISFAAGMLIDRRLVTGAAKAELSEAAYAKVKSKIPGGGIPFVNA